jgi:hypothetical protein
MNNLKDLKAEMLANPAIRQAYDSQAPDIELARELIAARTQALLAPGYVALPQAREHATVRALID